MMIIMLVLSLIVGFRTSVAAEAPIDMKIECLNQSDNCTMLYPVDRKLFNETNLLPGDLISKSMEVENVDDVKTCNLKISITNPTDTNNPKFSQKLYLLINKNTNGFMGNLVNGKPSSSFSLDDAYSLGELHAGPLYPGEKVNLEWIAYFDILAGNEYQRNETKFDLETIFSCDGDNRETRLRLTKTNNKLGSDLYPGDTVVYTLSLTAIDDVDNVEVTDLPPNLFDYMNGSWTANSSVRGNLKPGVTTEPTYHSPGDWKVGNMKANEVVTLSYEAKIGSEVKPGIHPDLAFAKGNFGGIVMANADNGYYVGTNVKVIEKPNEVAYKVEGEVLGATTVLPATGIGQGITIVSVLVFLICIIGLIIVDSRMKKSSDEINNSKLYNNKDLEEAVFGEIADVANSEKRPEISDTMTKLLMAAGLMMLTANSVNAAGSLNVRLMELPEQVNYRQIKLSFVTLDTDHQNVKVTCMVKKDANDFLPYGQIKDLIAGGDNDSCDDASVVVTNDGNYSFKVIATNGTETVESNVVNTKISNTNTPSITDYKHERIECMHKVSFRVSDFAIAQLVEVYRSTEKDFKLDSGNLSRKIEVNPNQNYNFEDHGDKCDYYYALVLLGQNGNRATPVGDNITIQTTNTTVLPNAYVAKNSTLNNSLNDSIKDKLEGDILGLEASDSAIASESSQNNLNQTDHQKSLTSGKYGYIGIASGILVLIVLLWRRRVKS